MRFLQSILILFSVGSAAALAGPLDRAEKFRPDVYPSKVQAAEGLARRVADALNSSLGFAERGSTLLLRDDRMCAEANEAMAGVFREEFPAAFLTVGGDASSTTSDAAKTIIIEPGADGDSDEQGTVVLKVLGGGVDRSFTARYLNKPWAADFKVFVHDRPKQQWAVGESSKLTSKQADALALARRGAATELTPLVIDRLNQRFGGRRDRVLVGESFVTSQIETALRKGTHIEDSFAQRLEAPSGEVWKASILVSASPATIDSLATQVSQAARAQAATRKARQMEEARGWGSVAGFLAVIFLLYMLINALTRGYFLWRLRAAALLLSIVGILIVLAVT